MLNTPAPFLFFLFFFSAFVGSAQDTTIVYNIQVPILNGLADVEEFENGNVFTSSTDLELTVDPDNQGEQFIGLHFENILLSSDADIQSAYLQFTTDETSDDPTDLQIKGEAVANASAFGLNNSNLSNRTLTSNNIPWSPAPWLIENESGINQRSPDITMLLQEIISQPDWVSGNAINLFIEGSGYRVAHAYEGNPDFAATLNIEASSTVLNGDLSNIFINELMAANNTFADEYGETDDWVELYNANDQAVLLQNVFLSDDTNDKMKWQIEGDVIIPANGFLLLWLDDAPDQGNLHAPFKLSSGGEQLYLSQIQNSNLIVMDEIVFEDIPQNISYGRETDGNDNWVYFGEFSPQASNNDKGLYLNANLTFSIPSGFYSDGTALTISADLTDVDIYYTLDGSDPTINNNLYTQAISLDQNTLVRAAAFKTGFASSRITEAFYLINEEHDLPVIQLSIDPKYLWDSQQGMYISGANGIPGYCSDQPRNWNQDWERPAKIRYFEPDGTEAFNLNIGLKIGGGCSRGLAMKGLNVFFRGNAYGDEVLNYPLFADFDVEQFKRFKLRASGNDFTQTMVRDGAIQSMLYHQVDLDLMAYQPAVVYLNNEYWGCYGVREAFTKHYVAAHHNVDEDNIDLIKNPYRNEDLKEGDLLAWNTLTNYISNNNLTTQNNFDYVADRIDINEYINYNITQVYIANFDWPSNNVAVWRSRDNGKFRWMLFDTDISSGYGVWSPAEADFNTIQHATAANGPDWPNHPSATILFRKLLQNQDFKNEFIQRTCTFAQTIFSPDRSAHFIDSLTEKIASEIPKMLTKYNNAPNDWQLWNENPVGGSVGAWQGQKIHFKSFFAQRYSFLLDHYISHFSLSGKYNLKLNFDASSGGTIVLHENEMTVPYQYTGDYFQNVPMRVKVIPKPEYEFVRWKETGDTTAIIYFSASESSILTPIFSKNGEVIEPPEVEPIDSTTIVVEPLLGIYPNPATTVLTIKYAEPRPAPFSFRIFNALGQLIYSENLLADRVVQEYHIDVSRWANGVYFLEGEIGEKDVLEKLLIGR